MPPLIVPVLAVALVVTGCATSRPPARTGVIQVAASINAWGSILAQLGGTHVHATSIITNPDTDPHSYEPTPADARVIADAQLFVDNGIGYDTWAAKSLAASPDQQRKVIDVGDLVHVADGGNPHRWYDPSDVLTVAATITADLKTLDPADAAYFDQQHAAFVDIALKQYDNLIKTVQTRFAGVAVGASESIFAPLASALKLNLITPPSFLKAISEGTDPSAADKSTIDHQIAEKRIAVYVYNSQNSTPDVSAQVAACKRAGIPVVAVTETLSPAGASFQQWQTTQLAALITALHKATGK